MVPKNQTDLSDQGTFFSLVVIYMMNLLLLSVDAHSCVPTDYVCRFRLRFTDKSWQLRPVAGRSFRKTARVTIAVALWGDGFARLSIPASATLRTAKRLQVRDHGERQIDIASASFTRRSCTGIGRQVKRSCACANGSVSGMSTSVSFQLSPIGENQHEKKVAVRLQ